MENSIIQIEDILVSSEIVEEFFSCDYEQCRGACCIVGDSGAPLLQEECALLEANYAAFAPLMSAEGRKKAEAKGFFEVDVDGDLVTPLMDHPYAGPDSYEGENYPCVYTKFEEKGCFCAIERAYCTGKSAFVKPVSCRLYPIRVLPLSNGTKALNLHRWHLCKKAFEKGKMENVRV